MKTPARAAVVQSSMKWKKPTRVGDPAPRGEHGEQAEAEREHQQDEGEPVGGEEEADAELRDPAQAHVGDPGDCDDLRRGRRRRQTRTQSVIEARWTTHWATTSASGAAVATTAVQRASDGRARPSSQATGAAAAGMRM